MAAFYHGSIKQLIVAFAGYFSDIHIIRRDKDSVKGNPIADIKVPIAFSNRAKWLHQIVEGTREHQIKVSLPRIGFEITSFTYDSTRKKSRNQQVKCIDSDGNIHTVNNPVPWNVELSMYVVADTQEDALQIVEQILPQFNPDITIVFNSVLGIKTNVPVSLNSCSMQDDYEGSMTDDRLVIYTLTFTAQLDLYGEVDDVGNINDATNNSTINDKINQSNIGGIKGGNIGIVFDIGDKNKNKHEIRSPGVYLE